MKSKLLLSLAAAGGTLALSFVPWTDRPGPVVQPADAAFRGPGAVIDAVQAFLRALDSGNPTMMKLLVGQDGLRDGYVVKAQEEDGKVKLKQAKGDTAGRFFEVSWDGRPVVAKDRKTFFRQLGTHVTCAKIKARTVRTKIHSIRVDCPAPECSYAVVEFERQYWIGRKAQPPIPMQATALVRYVKRKAGEKAPHFEIFHWHASRAAAAAPAAPAGAVKKGL